MVKAALDQGVGYGIVIGLGAFFALGKSWCYARTTMHGFDLSPN